MTNPNQIFGARGNFFRSSQK